MKAWVFLAAVAAGIAGVLWAKQRFQNRAFTALIRASHGDATRARRVTLLWEVCAAVVAIAVLVAAFVAQQFWHLFYVRIPLALLVIGLYVPFALMLSKMGRLQGKVRKTPQRRLMELGASPEVATAIARAGQPFAICGSVLFLGAVAAIAWHPLYSG